MLSINEHPRESGLLQKRGSYQIQNRWDSLQNDSKRRRIMDYFAYRSDEHDRHQRGKVAPSVEES
jgi:hypothetical protein